MEIAKVKVAKEVERMYKFASNHGIGFLLVLHPTMVDLGPFAQLTPNMFSINRGDILDLYPLFETIKNRSNGDVSGFIWPEEGHFTSVGYFIMAQAIARHMSKSQKVEFLSTFNNKP